MGRHEAMAFTDDDPDRRRTAAGGEVPELGERGRTGEVMDDGRGRTYPCEECGADLEFHIGDQALKCPYCGHIKQLDIRPDAAIEEQDFDAMIERLQQQRDRGEEVEPGQSEVRCRGCGGNIVFTGTLTSSECPYCGAKIQRENVHTATKRIPVQAVIPFLINHDRAARALREWVSSRWFAPNEFLKRGVEGKFNGVYFPYWTFDSMTFTAYEGERGDSYTVVVGSGQNQRTEVRIRWSPAGGRFQRFFDDVYIVATKGLPRSVVQDLEPWPVEKAIPFNQEVLSGFFARTYDVQLNQGFQEAKQRIEAWLEQDVRRRIGGDQQRITLLRSRYDAITFKHVLLPVWMMAYRFQDKPYRVFINAATGEVQGERPYSAWKIALAVLLGAIVVIGFIALQNSR
jgi:DNA-directed RNA polymerase subunit RPC12/RpoP